MYQVSPHSLKEVVPVPFEEPPSKAHLLAGDITYRVCVDSRTSSWDPQAVPLHSALDLVLRAGRTEQVRALLERARQYEVLASPKMR